MAIGGLGAVGRWEDIRVSLGSDAEVTGKLSFATPTRIEGRLKGEVRASDVLVVGPQAVVEATVQADQLIVLGEVRGDVKASTRLEICSGGKLYGDVETTTFVVREGGTFEGFSRMGRTGAVATAADADGARPLDGR